MSKVSKLTLVKQQLVKTPNVKAATVAKHLGISQEYAYNLMSTARKSLGMLKLRDGKWTLKTRMQIATVVTTNKPITQESNSPHIVETHYDAKQTALDVQVGGDHYKNLAIQPVEFCEKNKLSHLESSIVKRVCRWRTKDGLKDLLKIKHEVDLLIELNNLK
jgi:hypothetical protein